MSRYLLDTNIISNITKPVPSKALLAWMADQIDADLFVASSTSQKSAASRKTASWKSPHMPEPKLEFVVPRLAGNGSPFHSGTLVSCGLAAVLVSCGLAAALASSGETIF